MSVRVINSDVMDGLRQLPDESVHCCVTSPPYFGLRDYEVEGQIGLEKSPGEYVTRMVNVFRELRRVLRADGVLFLNIGDSYANDGKWGGSTGGKHVTSIHGDTGIGRGKRETGLKPKDLIGIPWRLAFALQDDGWWLRGDYIWHKPNPMPESVTDRCTKAHEYVFHLTKSEKYFWDQDAVSEMSLQPLGTAQQVAQHKQRALGANETGTLGTNQGRETRNKRSVWTIATAPFPEAHFATFPPELPGICIKAGCPKGGTVLDPFGGAGTTGLVADRLQRDAILIEINPAYAAMAEKRVSDDRGGLLDAMEAAE